MKDEHKEDLGGFTRRDFLYIGGIGMAGIALAGVPPSGHGAEKKPKYGGRLRMSERYGSPGLDVHKNQEFVDYQNYSLMYHGLTEMGPMPFVEMYPQLAKSWEISPDGKEYIFPLREGIKYHHGKELDSGDVKYSVERVMNPATRSPRAFAFRWIDSVNIIDKYTVKIKLKEPYAPFLTTLTRHNCSIIPAGSEPTGTKPAPGTGPFVFKSFVPNDTTEYTRFDKYWEFDEVTGDRLPYLDGFYIKKIPDGTVAYTALRAGDLDFVSSPPLETMAKALKEKPVPGIIFDYEFPGNHWIGFNLTKPPYDNKKVRQAISYAIDRKEVVQGVFWGLGDAVNDQPFLNQSRFRIPVPEREVDYAKAKKLLAEAGYPNGFNTEILIYSVHYGVAGSQIIAGQLQKIGIHATIKVLDMAAYRALLRKGDFSIGYVVESERYDWDDAYFMYLHSGEIGKNNYARYSNKEMDSLLEKGRITLKREERIPIYTRVIEMVREDLPYFYILKGAMGIAFRDYLKGYRKGFTMRLGWHGGGAKYWWLDK